MNQEMGPRYWTGEDAITKKVESDQIKNDTNEQKNQEKLHELKKRFDSIEVGSTVAYKNTQDTPVEFYSVVKKDEETMTVSLRTSLGNTETQYGVDAVTMDKIIDVQK